MGDSLDKFNLRTDLRQETSDMTSDHLAATAYIHAKRELRDRLHVDRLATEAGARIPHQARASAAAKVRACPHANGFGTGPRRIT